MNFNFFPLLTSKYLARNHVGRWMISWINLSCNEIKDWKLILNEIKIEIYGVKWANEPKFIHTKVKTTSFSDYKEKVPDITLGATTDGLPWPPSPMGSLKSLESDYPIIDSNFQNFCASHGIFSGPLFKLSGHFFLLSLRRKRKIHVHQSTSRFHFLLSWPLSRFHRQHKKVNLEILTRPQIFHSIISILGAF